MFRSLAFASMLLITASAVAAPKTDAAEKAADDRDKVICKRFLETGSLVRGYKTCKTKWEWERERENLRSVNVSDSCANRGSGGPCG
jgi:hypothetical protein